jgi:RNase P subunit RPR2
LWKNIVLNKDAEALKQMSDYCMNDVVILEKVYNELANYIPNKTHHGVIMGGEKCSCPECGSDNMSYSKKRLSALGTARIQMQCNECGKYHTVSERIYQKHLQDKEENESQLLP